MSQKYSIARTNLICWVTTILLISACFMVFFVHQKYQDFRQTSRLLLRQQERMMTEALAAEAQSMARFVAVSRQALSAEGDADPAPRLTAMLQDLNMVGEQGGNLLLFTPDGTLLLAPEKGFVQGHLKPIVAALQDALSKPTAAGASLSGEFSLTPQGANTPIRLRWHALTLAAPDWRLCVLCDMRRAESVASANLNRLRVDIMMETGLLLLVALAVILVAVRFAYLIARAINREVGTLTGYCQAGLAEDLVLKPESFLFREFGMIGLAVTAMVRQIRDLLMELKSAAIRSTLASQSQSSTLASVSHDLLSRLNAIVGTAQIMQVETATKEQHRRHLDTIVAAGRAMATMIENVDYTSVLDTDGFRPTLAPCQLSQVREQVTGVLLRAAGARGHELTWDFSPDLPAWIVSDQHLLRQVLLNLAEIGIYGNVGGQVKIAASSSPGTTDGKVSLAFAVQLERAGLSRTELDEIRRFPHVSRRYATVSLRVAICQRLVELLAGRFELNLNGEQGLVAKVNFEAEIATPPAVADNAAVVGGTTAGAIPRMRVLLVEDDPVNLEVTTRMLGHLGAVVATAENGNDALGLLREKDRFDLVIMDCEMPVMDGYATTREIRRLESEGSHTPVVALSGYAMPDDEARCREAGMDAFMAKPVTMEDLRAMLAKFAPAK